MRDPARTNLRRVRRILLAPLAAVALLAGLLPAVAPPAQAEPLFGHDISWPQCPSSVGGFDLPMPPDSTQFVIAGLTKGLPFTENPCLASQVDWVQTRNKPAHAYTMAAFPTSAQLSTYGSQGPWSTSTRAGQLSNVGYAEATYAAGSLDRVGWTPPVVWIDVEPRPAQPWPTGNAAQQRENRYVIEGLMRGLRDNGYAYGQRLAGDHRRLASPGCPRVGDGRTARLPQRGSGPVHPAQLLGWARVPLAVVRRHPGL